MANEAANLSKTTGGGKGGFDLSSISGLFQWYSGDKEEEEKRKLFGLPDRGETNRGAGPALLNWITGNYMGAAQELKKLGGQSNAESQISDISTAETSKIGPKAKAAQDVAQTNVPESALGRFLQGAGRSVLGMKPTSQTYSAAGGKLLGDIVRTGLRQGVASSEIEESIQQKEQFGALADYVRQNPKNLETLMQTAQSSDFPMDTLQQASTIMDYKKKMEQALEGGIPMPKTVQEALADKNPFNDPRISYNESGKPTYSIPSGAEQARLKLAYEKESRLSDYETQLARFVEKERAKSDIGIEAATEKLIRKAQFEDSRYETEMKKSLEKTQAELVTKGVPSEISGRVASANLATETAIPGLKKILFPDGTPDSFRRDIALKMANPIFRINDKDAQQAYRYAGNSLSGKLLIQSGVAVRPEELENERLLFQATAISNPEAAFNALSELEKYYNDYLDTSVPSRKFPEVAKKLGMEDKRKKEEVSVEWLD